MVQRRAARFVLNDYYRLSSVTKMLSNLQWPSLQTRRKLCRLSLMYKIVNNLSALSSETYLTIFKYSFFPRSVPEWNDLPESVINSNSFDVFKGNIKAHSMALNF